MASKSNPAKPSIVFCHGIWADGSFFNKVISTLQADDAGAGQQPGYSRRTLLWRRCHHCGWNQRPRRCPGLHCCTPPDADETSQSQQEKYPVTDVFSHIAVADGRIWMLPEGVESFAGDLSEQEKKFVWATHFAPAADLFTQKLDGVAWRSKPSSYIVATNDRTVQAELQRFLAKRMGAVTHEVATSHVPMLSHPDLVIKVICDAAKVLQRATAVA